MVHGRLRPVRVLRGVVRGAARGAPVPRARPELAGVRAGPQSPAPRRRAPRRTAMASPRSRPRSHRRPQPALAVDGCAARRTGPRVGEPLAPTRCARGLCRRWGTGRRYRDGTARRGRVLRRSGCAASRSLERRSSSCASPGVPGHRAVVRRGHVGVGGEGPRYLRGAMARGASPCLRNESRCGSSRHRLGLRPGALFAAKPVRLRGVASFARRPVERRGRPGLGGEQRATAAVGVLGRCAAAAADRA